MASSKTKFSGGKIVPRLDIWGAGSIGDQLYDENKKKRCYDNIATWNVRSLGICGKLGI